MLVNQILKDVKSPRKGFWICDNGILKLMDWPSSMVTGNFIGNSFCHHDNFLIMTYLFQLTTIVLAFGPILR